MKEDKIIKLKTEISNLRGKTLEKIIGEYLNKNKKIICKGLNKRPIFIDKYLEFNISRNDGHNRMKAFFSGVELIKKAKYVTDSQKIGNNLYSYEFKGITPRGQLVGVHIKEVIEGKNKIFRIISSFWDNKKI